MHCLPVPTLSKSCRIHPSLPIWRMWYMTTSLLTSLSTSSETSFPFSSLKLVWYWKLFHIAHSNYRTGFWRIHFNRFCFAYITHVKSIHYFLKVLLMAVLDVLSGKRQTSTQHWLTSLTSLIAIWKKYAPTAKPAAMMSTMRSAIRPNQTCFFFTRLSSSPLYCDDTSVNCNMRQLSPITNLVRLWLAH